MFVLGITHIIQIVVFYYQYLINKNYQGTRMVVDVERCRGNGIRVYTFTGNSLNSQDCNNRPEFHDHFWELSFCISALCGFLTRRENRVIIISIFTVFLASLLYFLYVNDDIQIRSIIIAATLAIVSFLTAHGLFVNKTRSVSSSANFTCGDFSRSWRSFYIPRCDVAIGNL